MSSRHPALLCALALIAGCARDARRREAPAVAATPRPRAVAAVAARAVARPPLVVLGLDGADWQLLDRLMAEGKMPELSRLVGSGRRFALESEHPPLSPILWTTIVTGVSPLEHGILDFSRFRPGSGEREPIGSGERKAPALWNLATWAGKRSAILGLWATWPAEPVDGLLVSDRFFGFLHVESGPPAGAVFPPERQEEAVATLRRVEREVDLAELRRYLPDLSEAELAAHGGAERAYDHPIPALRRIVVETRVYDELARAALDAPGDRPPDLTFVYLQGTDSIGHVFAPYAAPRQPSIPEAEFARFSGVGERYFEQVDRLLGRYRTWAEEHRATLALVSDHGFLWSDGRPERLSSVDNTTAAKWHRKEGIALFVGYGDLKIAPGRDATPAPLRRVAATLAALAGIPPGRDLAGPPLVPVEDGGEPVDYRALFAAFRAESPTATTTPTAASSAGAAEELAKLRALGYLGGAEPDRAPAAVAAAGSPGDPTRTGGSYNNEGLILKSLGRRAEALAAFERALELDPRLASALWNLSDLLFEAKERERSDELLVRALAAGFVDGERQAIERALADHRAGDTARALALLDAALAAKGDSARLHLFRGRFRVDRNECAGALDDFRAAESLAPADPAAPASAGMALLCLGRKAEAIESLRRSLVLDPDQPPVAAYVAQLERAPGR